MKKTTKPQTIGDALIDLAELGKKHPLAQPTDLSENLDDYLYGNKTVPAERCSVCGGRFVTRTVNHIGEYHNRVFIVRDVPAVVCDQCGKTYYSAPTVAQMDELIRSGNPDKLEPALSYDWPDTEE